VVIALFGTSADPPTEGHRVLLQGLLNLYPRVATWASDNPQKHHGAPLALRAELLGALVAALHDPRLSLEQELSSPWAIETLERAARRWPGQPLVFVVGSDLVAQIPRWREASRLLGACRLAVAPRGGWPLRGEELEALQRLGARLEVLDLQVPATASSRVRQQAAIAPRTSPEPHAASGSPQPSAAQPPGVDPPADEAGATPAALPDDSRPWDPEQSDPLQEVPPALRPVLLEHNLYGLQGPLPPPDPS
jgi:nicotinate-nucleotide adenylyltransferase